MATKKKVAKTVAEEVKKPTLKAESVKARFSFEYRGKIYERGDVLTLLDGDAKSLVDRGFAERV